MSLKKRIIAALTALALLILPLAACGGKGNGTATSRYRPARYAH